VQTKPLYNAKMGLPFLLDRGINLEKFEKESLTAEEQLNLLIKRNLKVDNYKSAVDILKRVGYYHLSSYMRLFQEGENHIFKDNVEFADLINLFNFDSELRHITFKAIEKIEVAYRVAISNVMCKKYGSHWFTNKETFKTKIDLETNQEIDYVEICKEIINKEIKKKDDEYAETFIANYYNKYNEPELPPFWMVVETFTIGSLNKLYQNINPKDKKEIIEYLGFNSDAKFIRFSNWLYALSVIRNICAHHSRLFNRIFRISPSKHDKIQEFQGIDNNRFYYISMIINYYLVTILNDKSFEIDLQRLFSKYKSTDKTKMGFPKDWDSFSITPMGKNLIKTL